MSWPYSSSSSSSSVPPVATPPPSAAPPAGDGKVGLYSLNIYKCPPSSSPESASKVIQLSSSVNLQSFPFFHRSTIKEHIQFHSRLVASRTPTGARQRVEFERNLGFCHAYVHPSGLAATCLTSSSYPIRVAFGLITQSLRKFQELYCGRWESLTSDVPEGTMFSKEGADLVQTYQNPVEADKLLKVQKDLEEVKDVMLKNIDDLLQRGEKLEDLMQKSEDLSTTSYQFFRQAKRNNQCCQLY
eukprot:GHVS01080422.1.p2 GENE.GHVS01080422.1~~GHVS01080422.1.p2  ORF type:complete len:243 (+),score=53.00 GHVS01080422.1:108-836(+)